MQPHPRASSSHSSASERPSLVALLAGRRARSAQRGVTLIEVLIVLAIMAVIAGGAAFALFPALYKSRIEAAHLGTQTVRNAAKMYLEVDNPGGSCPTVETLVQSKKLEQGKTDDPWGTPYKIQCTDDDIRVVSCGRDKKEGSGDDIKDIFKKSDLEKLATQ
jgi:general secretion pathway protein G